jgi:hypothetical protein
MPMRRPRNNAMARVRSGRGATGSDGALGGPATSTTGEGLELSLSAFPYCVVRSFCAIVSAASSPFAAGVVAACNAVIRAPTAFRRVEIAVCCRIRVPAKSASKALMASFATVLA